MRFGVMSVLVVGLGALTLQACAPTEQDAYGDLPFQLNPNNPLHERVDTLLAQLTLEEKQSLMGTTAPAIERLGIPAMWGWNQSLHGVVWGEPTSMFPVNIGMSATWNPDLIRDVAGVIHDEARAIYNYLRTVESTPFVPEATQGGRGRGGGRGGCGSRNGCLVTAAGDTLWQNGIVYRSPVVEMSRQPLWGRIHEAYGEDPFLSEQMAAAYVQGMQGDDPNYLKVVATVKHYAINNQEANRRSYDAHVDERWIHEYYLRPYRAGIVDGGAQSIMSTYNSLNGVPGAANAWLMDEVLRGMWGFEGFGVPDSGGISTLLPDQHNLVETRVEAAAKAVLSGHDLDEGGIFPEEIVAAVEQGLITEADVDRSVGRVLTARMRLGEFDPPEMVPYNDLTIDDVKSPAHRQLTLEAARQSLVLLSNDAGVLPFDRDEISSIAVIGPHADFELTGIGYTGVSDDFVVPLEGIQSHVAPGTEVIHVRGSDILPDDPNPESGYVEAEQAAAQADAAVVVVGTSRDIEREGVDREILNLMPNQQELVERVLAANPNTVVVLVNAGPLSLTGGRPGMEVPTAVMAFMAGEEGGNAIAEVLFGDYNPAGRLPYTVYYSADDVPGWEEYDISQGYTYMYFEGEPEWPFGHGLSYTTFEYSNVDVSPGVDGNGQLTVSVDVQNTGEVAGDEVVQLYVRDLEPRLVRPQEWLVAFERVNLAPGESQTVTLTAPARELSFYDVEQSQFVVEPGPYEARVGASSADIRQTASFEVTSAGQFPP